MPDTGDPKAESEGDPVVEREPEAEAAPLSIQDPDFDETVGFASTAALEGRPIQPVETGEAPGGDLLDAAEPSEPPSAQPPAINAAPEADLVSDVPPPAPDEEPSAGYFEATPDAGMAYAPIPSREERRRQREAVAAAPADDRMLWAYTVYALILFSVPTLGVSAAIGVLAVTGRAVKADEPVKSHYIFQQRTLWSAAVIALIGLALIPIGLGVFVLFALAVWILARGAFGLLRLKAGRGVDNPRSWLI